MSVITYAFFAYGLTIVISFAVVGIIVLINNLMSKSENEKEVNLDA